MRNVNKSCSEPDVSRRQPNSDSVIPKAKKTSENTSVKSVVNHNPLQCSEDISVVTEQCEPTQRSEDSTDVTDVANLTDKDNTEVKCAETTQNDSPRKENSTSHAPSIKTLQSQFHSWINSEATVKVMSGTALGYLGTTVHGHEMKMLVDSGASHSALDYSWYQTMGKPGPLFEFETTVLCAGQTPLNIYGYTFLKTSVEDQPSQVIPFLIADIGEDEAIMGLDMLQRLGAQQDHGKGTITINGSTYYTRTRREMEDDTEPSVKNYDVYTATALVTEDAYLQPGQRVILDAHVSGQLPRKTVALLSPVSRFAYKDEKSEDSQLPEGQNVKFTAGIVQPVKGKFQIEVMNFSDQAVTVKQNQVLGCLVQLDEDQITSSTDDESNPCSTSSTARLYNLATQCGKVPLQDFKTIPIEVKAKDVTTQTNKPEPSLTSDPYKYMVADDHNVWYPPDQDLDLHQEVPSHLQSLIDGLPKDLTPEQLAQVKATINHYQDAFTGPEGEIGRTSLVTHTINTGENEPIKQAPRRQSPVIQKVIKDEVQKMLDKGVIEPSCSPWASPVVIVKKKDGTHRFCVDYRKLNDLTHKDAHPIPRLQDCLETLRGAKWFSTLDLHSGYWQVAMDEKDKEKTAFATTSGLYQFTVMSFGLTNAPASFQRLMELILTGMSTEQLQLYLDDVLVIGALFREALRNLCLVFHRAIRANIRFKPTKCSLFQKQVQFLGHVVSHHGISCDPAKLKSVARWPVPKTPTDVRSFIGFCAYYRRFIKGFSEMTAPLFELTKKDVPFDWTEERNQAFEALKEALMNPPVLTYPQPEGEFILDTDASLLGLGAVLSQIQDGEERVIHYWSRALTKTEKHYCPTYLELLAVKCALEAVKPYIYQQSPMIRTDHASLTWLLNFKKPEGMLARWLAAIQEYNLSNIKHRPGRLHVNADALSRIPKRPCPREDCLVCQERRKLKEKRLAEKKKSQENLVWLSEGISTDSGPTECSHSEGLDNEWSTMPFYVSPDVKLYSDTEEVEKTIVKQPLTGKKEKLPKIQEVQEQVNKVTVIPLEDNPYRKQSSPHEEKEGDVKSEDPPIHYRFVRNYCVSTRSRHSQTVMSAEENTATSHQTSSSMNNNKSQSTQTLSEDRDQRLQRNLQKSRPIDIVKPKVASMKKIVHRTLSRANEARRTNPYNLTFETSYQCEKEALFQAIVDLIAQWQSYEIHAPTPSQVLWSKYHEVYELCQKMSIPPMQLCLPHEGLLNSNTRVNSHLPTHLESSTDVEALPHDAKLKLPRAKNRERSRPPRKRRRQKNKYPSPSSTTPEKKKEKTTVSVTTKPKKKESIHVNVMNVVNTKADGHYQPAQKASTKGKYCKPKLPSKPKEVTKSRPEEAKKIIEYATLLSELKSDLIDVPDLMPAFSDIWLSKYALEDLKTAQEHDEDIRVMRDLKKEFTERPKWNSIASESAELKTYWTLWNEIEFHHDILYRQAPIKDTSLQPPKRYLVPLKLRNELMELAHDHITAGHLGEHKTYGRLKKKFYWYKCKQDIKRWCRACHQCALVKPGGEHKKAPLVQIPVGAPMEKIASDLMGPLTPTSKGNVYMLVVEDYFTKWIEVYPIPSKEAYDVADKLCTEWIPRFGIPYQYHTDQGREFENQVIYGICDLMNIEKTRTTPYRPASDGLVERSNRTILSILRVVSQQHRKDWDDLLPFVMMAYRTTIQESTNCTPSMLMFGREISTPLDLQFERLSSEPDHYCSTKYVQWLQNALREAYTLARDHLKKAAMKQKRNYNRDAHTRQFQPGSWIYVRDMVNEKSKLGCKWKGPYLVVGRRSDTSILYQTRPDTPTRVIHMNLVKKCEGPHPLSWLQDQVTPDGDAVLSDMQQLLSESDAEKIEDQDVMVIPQNITEPRADATSEESGNSNTQTDSEKEDTPPPRTRSGRITKPPQRYTP
mgnify:FL=1